MDRTLATPPRAPTRLGMPAIIRTKGVRIRRRIRPAPSRTIVRRVRASTTIFGAWEIRSEPSMIGCEVASTQRPRKGVATGSAQSESSAPTATTSYSFFRRFGRSFRTLCSSRQTSTPWYCIRQHGLIRAIFWLHRVSDCSSTTIFSTRSPHFAAAIRPPRFWLRKQRFKAPTVRPVLGTRGPCCSKLAFPACSSFQHQRTATNPKPDVGSV